MTLRDDLVPLLDEVRGDIVDELAGLRRYDVAVVTRTWSGGVVGRGTVTETSLPIVPRPRVRDPSPRARIAEAGRFEEGDRQVDKISVTFTRAQLDGLPLAAGVELLWTIDGAPYRVVGVTEKYLTWEVQLRAVRAR